MHYLLIYPQLVTGCVDTIHHASFSNDLKLSNLMATTGSYIKICEY